MPRIFRTSSPLNDTPIIPGPAFIWEIAHRSGSTSRKKLSAKLPYSSVWNLRIYIDIHIFWCYIRWYCILYVLYNALQGQKNARKLCGAKFKYYNPPYNPFASKHMSRPLLRNFWALPALFKWQNKYSPDQNFLLAKNCMKLSKLKIFDSIATIPTL